MDGLSMDEPQPVFPEGFKHRFGVRSNLSIIPEDINFLLNALSFSEGFMGASWYESPPIYK